MPLDSVAVVNPTIAAPAVATSTLTDVVVSLPALAGVAITSPIVDNIVVQ